MTTTANRPDATPEQRLLQLGITLPPPWADKPNRVRALRSGIHVFMSGHGPLDPATDAPLVVGKLGRELDIEQGAAAASESSFRRRILSPKACCSCQINELIKPTRMPILVSGKVEPKINFTEGAFRGRPQF